MGYQDITTGDKTGRAKAARFIESKNGTMGFEVSFELVEPSTGGTERLNWVGWLSEDAIKFTMDTLVNVLEFNGNDEVGPDGLLKDPNALNYKKEFKLVVEIEEYDGKSYPKIKWVNNLGGSAFQACKPETVSHGLMAVGFKAAFLAVKQAKGQSVPAPAPQPATEDEVPF